MKNKVEALAPEGGEARDSADWARLRHARDRNTGFPVGRYLQPPPMLFTRDGHNAFLGDMYRGCSAFLICGGPSLASHDLSRLDRRGVLTLAVNNAAAVYRPRLWCSVDDPSHFVDSIWKDSGITKFVPLCHVEKPIHSRDAELRLVACEDRVGDMPAVFCFRRNESFVADQWLFEDTFNWGNHSKRVDQDGNKGSRSVMYIALRLLFYLGVRRVFLLGCDFKMQEGRANYAFDQDRSSASIRSNNTTYQILNRRFEKLRPHFEAHDFQIFNCTPNSGLTVFPHVPYQEALQQAVSAMPKQIVTAGLYDGAARRTTLSPIPSEKLESPRAETETPVTVPPVTLIVPLEGSNLATFGQTWKSWTTVHAWLKSLPVVLASQETSVLSRTFGGLLPKTTRRVLLEPHPGTSGVRLGEFTGAMLDLLGEVETDWWLKLDADAVATDNSQPWPDPSWFQSLKSEGSPVLVGHRWGSVRSGRDLNELDHWSSRIATLSKGPSFGGSHARTEDRIRLSTISSWCLFGRTDWARRLISLYQSDGPSVPYGTFLHYCAHRMRSPVRAVNMKSLGWDHSFMRRGVAKNRDHVPRDIKNDERSRSNIPAGSPAAGVP